MTNKPQLPVDDDGDALTVAYMCGFERGKDFVIGRMQSAIDRWRTEADRLDREAADLSRGCRDADAARRQQDMRMIRRLAAELERVLSDE